MVATSDPRDAKGKSRPNKSFCDVAETTEVATKNRGRDINNQMGQLILKSTRRCIEVRAQLQNLINTQLLLKEMSFLAARKERSG